MGNSKKEIYHGPTSKPSGSHEGDDLGKKTAFAKTVEQDQEVTDKYESGANEMPANIKVRHPNRNVNKTDKSQIKKNKKSKIQTSEVGLDLAEELPGVLSRELFEKLVNFRAEYCISLYMRTHRSGVAVNEQEDNLSFKNALQQISADLKSKGVDQHRIQKMLKPGYELLANDMFWRNLEQGMAVFLADDFFRFIKMPESPLAELSVNNSFLVKPLVNAMTVKEYFYLLVISKKQVKFYKATAFGMQQIEIEELPNGIEDVVRLEEKEDQKLFRTESFQGGKGAAFHGHGAGKPDDKENIAMYLQEVDDTLWQTVLNKENVPLLLAGVEYILPIYKSVTRYGNICSDVITGSHEHDDTNTLFEMARAKMEHYFQERTKKALGLFSNQSATSLSSSVPNEIIPAAHYGRIRDLFLIRDTHLWGTFNDTENNLILHGTKEAGDECLADKAVIKTILNGGDVHFISREHMPGGAIMAALMRY